MRLLYFSRDYTPHDYRFLTALAGTNWQTAYLRLERNSHPLEKRALPPEIEIIQWHGGQRLARLIDGLSLLIDLKKVIRRTRPDVILAGPLQRCAFLVALSGFKPLVSMSWGYDLMIDAQRRPTWAWATRYTLQRSAVMVGDCATIRKIAASFGMPDERIITFPWGIDLKHFTAEGKKTTEQPGAPFSLLSTRSWESIYGVDLIAKAFVKAAKVRPELRLVMLGNGSLAGKLRQIFRRGGVLPTGIDSDTDTASHRVLFPGQVGYAELPRYYRSANLYLSASHSDGTSISLLEAMACGCPAVVSDIPGNQEWVSHGENGWIFPDGDTDALAQAILNAVEKRELLTTMGFQARRIVETHADWQINFPKLLSAFEIALSMSNKY